MTSQKDSVGVIVARFQTTKLHKGHRSLIDEVRHRHNDVLVVLGTKPASESVHDPLDFATRALMVGRSYPAIRIAELKDSRSDELWSKKLDEIIFREFPGRDAVLYGSRDSFLPHYAGSHPSSEIAPVSCHTGTNCRNGVDKPRASEDFRRGAIYTAWNRWPVSFQTVDVVVIDHDHKHLLLGKRTEDGGRLRFVGGFVDPKDLSLEYAGRREVIEETGRIEIGHLHYLGSFRIDDWRYRGSEHQIMTALFATSFIFGAPRASDDLDGFEWVPWNDFRSRLVEEHAVLGEAVETYVNRLS